MVAAAVRLQRLVQETWEEDTPPACKLRKLYHRAWLRGLVIGAVEGGAPAVAVARGIAEATVPIAYEEAIPLPVYAYSLGHGFGQSWAAASLREAERLVWLAALADAVGKAEDALHAAAVYHGQTLDADLAPATEKTVRNVESGFHLGALTGVFRR